MDNEAAVVDAKSTNWDNGMCPTKEFAEKNRGTPKDLPSGLEQVAHMGVGQGPRRPGEDTQ